MKFEEQMTNYVEEIENSLSDFLKLKEERCGQVIEAMRYSTLGGGKRLRGILVLAFAEMFGLESRKAMPFACAVEMIHSYSLIHDDLPCMDDDALRRGKPSCHIQFGEATGLLAGDALLTYAFEAITSADLPADRIVSAVKCLSNAAGSYGMIGGQVLDLQFESSGATGMTALTTIRKINKLKTGALIFASSMLGCIAAGEEAEEMSVRNFSSNLGEAFQIMDDILNVTGSEENMGKPVGNDLENEKTNYVSVFGLDKAQEEVFRLTDAAVKSIEKYGEKSLFLTTLAQNMANRTR